VAKKKIKLEWNREASIHFDEILEDLYEESEIAASIVGNAILDEIESLKIDHYSTAHPLDRFKKTMTRIFGPVLFIATGFPIT